MPESPKPQRFFLKTSKGPEIVVKCPICGHDEFLTARAPASGEGVGFQHLIVGREVVEGVGPVSDALSLPVRFQACSNCGYIVKFLLPEQSGG